VLELAVSKRNAAVTKLVHAAVEAAQ
jgi:hypothetical protein